MLTTETWPNIRNIPKGDWERLAGRDVMSSYGWLKTIEETQVGHTAPTYYLVKGNGVPLGASVSYFTGNSSDDHNLNTIFFGRMMHQAQKLGFSFLPALECYPFRAYGKHIFLAEHLDTSARQRVSEALLDGIEAEAARHQASPCFLHVMQPEEELWNLLFRRGYQMTWDYPLNYLDIEWSDFKGYKDFIRRRSRNMVRNITKEINRNRREGVVMETLPDVGEKANRLWELMNINYQKYNPGAFPFKRTYFQRLLDNLGDDVEITVARKKDRLTGVSVTLHRGAIAHIPMVGVDHAFAGPDATYFNLGCYQPIQNAIEKGLKRIYFGNAQYHLKQRRGCKISNCYIFYKSFRPGMNRLVGMWFHVHRTWFMRKHRSFSVQPYHPLTRNASP